MSTSQIARRYNNRVPLNGQRVGPDNVAEVATGDVASLMRACFSSVAPLAKVPTYREFARELRLPDGPLAGQIYEPHLDPIHDTVIRMLDDDWSRHVWIGCVQSGKSLLMALALLRNSTYNCKPVVYSQPTLPKIHEAWTGKIMPVVDACGLIAWKPQRGQGSHGSQTPRFFQWRRPGGNQRAGITYLIPGGGSSEAAQAAVTAQFVCVDEVDSFPARHRVELVAKRADSFMGDARRLYTSTIKDDENSIILGLHAESTKSRLQFACIGCKKYDVLSWENVRYDASDELTARESVRYACPHCGLLWDEGMRQSVLRSYRLVHDGQIVDDAGVVAGVVPRTETFGFLWTALDSSLRDIRVLAVEHYRAQKSLDSNGDHGPMRSFWRDQLCRQYKGEIEELDAQGPLTWNYLFNRSLLAAFGPVRIITDREGGHDDGRVEFLFSRRFAEPPDDLQWSVAAIDVQHNRLYWTLRGFDALSTSWFYGWGYEYARLDRANASPQELQETLSRTRLVIENAASGHDLQFIGLDVGDNMEELVDWSKTQGGIIRPMRGTTQSFSSKEFDIDGLAWFRDGVLIFQADHARDLLHAAFRRQHQAEGAALFPAGIEVRDNTVFRHMVSEQAGYDVKTRRRIVVKGSGRNDWLDCGKMTQVLMQGVLITNRDDKRVREARKAAEAARLAAAGNTPPLSPLVPESVANEAPQPRATAIRSALRRTDTDAPRPTSIGRTQRRYRRF